MKGPKEDRAPTKAETLAAIMKLTPLQREELWHELVERGIIAKEAGA